MTWGYTRFSQGLMANRTNGVYILGCTGCVRASASLRWTPPINALPWRNHPQVSAACWPYKWSHRWRWSGYVAGAAVFDYAIMLLWPCTAGKLLRGKMAEPNFASSRAASSARAPAYAAKEYKSESTWGRLLCPVATFLGETIPICLLKSQHHNGPCMA